MIEFIQIPLRRHEPVPARNEIRPVTAALILGMILCFQLGLVVWVFFKHLLQ